MVRWSPLVGWTIEVAHVATAVADDRGDQPQGEEEKRDKIGRVCALASTRLQYCTEGQVPARVKNGPTAALDRADLDLAMERSLDTSFAVGCLG